jgi:hypothetical protein
MSDTILLVFRMRRACAGVVISTYGIINISLRCSDYASMFRLCFNACTCSFKMNLFATLTHPELQIGVVRLSHDLAIHKPKMSTQTAEIPCRNQLRSWDRADGGK